MRVVLTGASGQLGSYLVPRLLEAGHQVDAWSGTSEGERDGVRLRPIDLTDGDALDRALGESDPDLVIHAAAVSTADAVRRDPRHGWAVNVDATSRIARWCSRCGRRLLYTSTDLVFDGTRAFSREDDAPNPILLYGRSKQEAEASVLALERGLVARTSLMFGPTRSGRPTYLDRTLEAIAKGEPQAFFEDEYRTPLDLATAAEALVRLAESDLVGIIHVAGAERLSRYDLARRVVAALGLDVGLLRAGRQSDAALPEPRPADVSLDTTRLAAVLPDLKRPGVEEAASALWATRPPSRAGEKG